MIETFDNQSGLMTRLTISALSQISNDDSIWKDPVVHRAILISGLSLFVQCAQYLENDLAQFDRDY